MKAFKGTPGPWMLDEFDNIVHGEAPSHGWGRKETVRVSGVALPGRVKEEYAANTRLVAAAPELLEALQMALEWIDAVPSDTVLPTMPGFDRDEVNNLIAKALGETK